MLAPNKCGLAPPKPYREISIVAGAPLSSAKYSFASEAS